VPGGKETPFRCPAHRDGDPDSIIYTNDDAVEVARGGFPLEMDGEVFVHESIQHYHARCLHGRGLGSRAMKEAIQDRIGRRVSVLFHSKSGTAVPVAGMIESVSDETFVLKAERKSHCYRFSAVKSVHWNNEQGDSQATDEEEER